MAPLCVAQAKAVDPSVDVAAQDADNYITSDVSPCAPVHGPFLLGIEL